MVHKDSDSLYTRGREQSSECRSYYQQWHFPEDVLYFTLRKVHASFAFSSRPPYTARGHRETYIAPIIAIEIFWRFILVNQVQNIQLPQILGLLQAHDAEDIDMGTISPCGRILSESLGWYAYSYGHFRATLERS